MLTIAYVTPLWLVGDSGSSGYQSIAYAVPTILLMGETVAWVSTRVRRSEERTRRNEARFRAKWGALTDDYDRLPATCFNSPYDSGRPLSWWPEQDQQGYSPSGALHE